MKHIISLKIGFIFFWCFMNVLGHGAVIVLHGASSAGKTSIMKCLQQIFQEQNPIVLSLDDFLWKVVIKDTLDLGLISESMSLSEKQKIIMLNWPIAFDKIIKNNWLEPQKNLHKAIEQAALQGRFVLVDTVHENEESYRNFCEQTKELDVMAIQIYCSLPTLVTHIMQRNHKLEYEEKRDLFWILKQYSYLYQQVDPSDESIDSMTFDDLEKSLAMVYNDLYGSMEDQILQEKIDATKTEYMRIFRFDAVNEVHLGSKFPYDFVVDTKNHQPEECAQLIYEQYNLNVCKK